MTGLIQLFSSDWAHSLGWALLHSLWEIALVAVSVALLLAAFRRRSANARYLVAVAGLLAMVALPVVTYCIVPARVDPTIVDPIEQLDVEVSALPPSANTLDALPAIVEMPPVSDEAPDVEAVASVPIAPIDETPPAIPLLAQVTQAFSPWIPWLVIVWLLGVCSLSVWNLGGWIAAQQLKHLTTTPVGGPLADRLAELARRMNVSRPVQMVRSCLVDVPIVVGWLRPVILMPVGILTGLSPAQLDAILAHELAHVRRHDYLVNLLQTLVETLLFYHPGVWWISRRIRIEREHCCDDAAVAVCGNKVDYAEALTALEAARALPELAMAAVRNKRGGTGLSRVRRVLGLAGSESLCRRKLLGGVLGVLLPIALLACVAVPVAVMRAADREARAPGESADAGSKQVAGTMRLEARVVGIDGKPVDSSSITFWKSVAPRTLQKSSTSPWPDDFKVPHVWKDSATGRTWTPVLHCATNDRATQEPLTQGVYRVTAFVGHVNPKALAVSDVIRLDGSREHTVVTVSVQSGPSLDIEVLDAQTGKGIEHPAIRLTRADGLPLVGWSGAWWLRPGGSEYTFEHLTPGDYTLEVAKWAHSSGEPEYIRHGPSKIELAAGRSRHVTVNLRERPVDEEEAGRRWPWAVTGTVTDEEGQGLEGVTIRAHCGAGTLRQQGATVTNGHGKYTLRFGPGMRILDEETGKWGAGLQAATISVSKPGLFEKNLYRQGGLMMADKIPPEDNPWRVSPEKVILPGKPYRVDFVMAPAAVIQGTLVDEKGRPIPDQRIRAVGEYSWPSTNVLAGARTDSEGAFKMDPLPTGLSIQFEHEKARTQRTSFAKPGRHEIKLKFTRGPATGKGRLLILDDAPAPADVSAVIVSLRSQLVRIGAKYPELAKVDEIRIEGSTHGGPDVRPGYGFEYFHQCKYLGKRGFEDTGPKAASIKFVVAKRRNKGEEFDFATQIASHVWPNLNLFGWTHLHVGSSPSPGFQAEIGEVLKRHVAMMNELDRRAASNPVEQVFTKVYDVGGLDIEAGFVPDAESTMLQEPSFVTFRVTNRSGKPYQFDIGGDNRGSVRHNDFRITAVDAAGRAVRDPYSYTNFGGMVQRVTLAPGKTHSQRLYLGHWLDLERPGQYTVTCKHTLEKHGRGPQHPPLAVSSQFIVTVTPQDAVAMAAVIARLGEQIREGEVSKLREATIALADVDDVRVIPHLAASLARGDYQNRIPAIKGLGRYGNDAAVEALRSALTDNDHAVRSAAGQALRKCDKGDQVARQLLKQLASDSADVRRLAARALGETGSEAAIEPLIAALKDPGSPVRCAAAVSLGELGRGEAADPLRQSLKRDDRALRVAAADGLRRLTGRFDPKWVTATIRETTYINDRTFHESIRLTRLYAGSDAAAALIGCLRFDDPSPRGSYNFYLILAIHHCKDGPDCYDRWKHDANRDGTKEEIENNQKILDELKQFAAEATGDDEIDARPAANGTTERTQETAEAGPNVDTSLTDNPRERFLEIERVARLPKAEQAKELKQFYTELAPRYMNPFVTGILSIYPRHILNRADTKHYDGNSERWAQQLEDAAKDLSPEEVADKLDIGLWLNIAAQARAMQVFRRHEKVVTAMIAAGLATRDKAQVEGAAATISTLGLHAFTDELLALLLANGAASEAAYHALLLMRDPDIAEPLLEHVAKDPSSLARCAGLLQSPLYRQAADPLLLKLLESPDKELRYHAVRAVYECRDPKLAPFVAKFADDDEARFRVAAAYMVRNLPDDSFIAVRSQLLPLLRDKNESVRFEALRSFGQKRDLAAGPVIIEALRREQLAEGLKMDVMQALNALTGDTFNYDTHNWGPSGQRNEEAMRKLEEWLETSLRALGDAWYVGGDAAKTMSKRLAADLVEKLTGVVTDEEGRPLEGVTIKMCGAEWFDEGRWHRNRRLACYFPRPTVSAKAGRFTVLFRKGLFELPFDEKTTRVNLWFDRDGFAPTYLPGMSPRPHDVKVVMKRGIRVSGTVKRLANGKPVPAPGVVVSLQCSSGDLAQQKRFFDDPLSTMKDTLEGCDLPYRKRVSTDVEGRYTVRLSPPPDDKKWCLFCSGQAVMLDVKQGQPTQGPDFVVEEEVSERAELKLLRGENGVKTAWVWEGRNASEILNALGRPDYVDDDPWFSYKASPEGSYVLLFEEQVSKTDAKPDLASVTLWGVRGPGTDAREGVFLLPRRLSGAACGDFIALRVRAGPGLKKVATVAVGMSSSDVLGLFRPARDLVAKEAYVLFPSIDDGEFLLVFSARDDGEFDDSASDRLSEVIYRPGGDEKPIYLLPFKKRGQTVPAEHKAFLENNRIRGNGNETGAAAHGTTGGADAPQHHGRISGVVVDGQEAPVAGAAVVLCRQATGVPFAEEARQTVAEVFLGGSQPTNLAYALTDEQGRFSFAKIPAGEYRLVAQSWPDADSIESLMAVHGAVLRLHGIVEHLEVTAESSPEAVIRPLGSGVLRLDEDMPNDGTLLVLSTAAPRADPVLGFVGWGGPFMHNLIGGTHMPAGKITVHGMPEGKVYIALFANDNRPGFGAKEVDIQAGKITDASVPIIADWSNGHREPPKRLAPLVEEVRSLMLEKDLSVPRLLEDHGIRLNAGGILQSQQQISEHLSDEIKLPTGRKTTFADFMAAVRYVELQQSAKAGSTGGL